MLEKEVSQISKVFFCMGKEKANERGCGNGVVWRILKGKKENQKVGEVWKGWRGFQEEI